MYSIDAIQSILYAMGVRKIKIKDDRIRMTCPFEQRHHHNGFDKHPSFFIKADGTLWQCFACKKSGASILGLMYQWCNDNGIDYYQFKNQMLEPIHYREIARQVDIRINPYEKKEIADQNEKFEKKESAIENSGILSNNLDEQIEIYERVKGKVPKYILNRGIPLEICKLATLGYDKENLKIYFPIRTLPGGEIMGMLTRGIGSEADYLFNSGFRKNVLYFEYETWENPLKTDLVLVEGAFDSLKLRIYGYNSVALLGCAITESQVEKIGLLCYQIATIHKMEAAGSKPHIVIMMDADKAGENAVKQILNELSYLPRTHTIKVAHLPQGKDPADATKEEIEDSLQTAVDKT